MHNSTAKEHKQGSTHTTGLILLREGNVDDTDMEIAEIINGTISDSSKNQNQERREESPNTLFDASDKPEGNKDIPAQQSQVRSTQVTEMSQFLDEELTDNSNHTTLPMTMNCEVITTGDQRLQ